MGVLLLIAGLVLLTVGAEILVRGASALARRFGVSALVVGLTVVAMGTSAPELAVGLQASLSGQADLAVGNIVGSNIFNVLWILGLAAVILPLAVSSRLVRVDVPWMVGTSLLVWVFAGDGLIGRVEGAILFGGLVVYTVWLIVLERRDIRAVADVPASAVPVGPRRATVALLHVVVGIALLLLGARWLVGGAVAIARSLGIGELAIGLTVVAAGTSAPELATSVVASLRGERDMAVGNVVGSNLFNLLAVLGASAAVAQDGVRVDATALTFDIPVMVAVSLLCLPVFVSGGRISRGEGLLFLLCFAAYLAVVLLHASRSPWAVPLGTAAPLFFLPLAGTGIALSVAAWSRRINARGS